MKFQRKKRIDASILKNLYLDEGMTITEKSALLKISKSTLRNWMMEAGISTRNKGTIPSSESLHYN